jgi:hypothetical protein
MNIRVELQNDQSGEVFSKKLLNIGNGKIPVDSSSRYIIFPTNFYRFTETKTKLTVKVFPNITQNYKDHVWLSERVVLVVKKMLMSMK